MKGIARFSIHEHWAIWPRLFSALRTPASGLRPAEVAVRGWVPSGRRSRSTRRLDVFADVVREYCEVVRRRGAWALLCVVSPEALGKTIEFAGEAAESEFAAGRELR